VSRRVNSSSTNQAKSELKYYILPQFSVSVFLICKFEPWKCLFNFFFFSGTYQTMWIRYSLVLGILFQQNLFHHRFHYRQIENVSVILYNLYLFFFVIKMIPVYLKIGLYFPALNVGNNKGDYLWIWMSRNDRWIRIGGNVVVVHRYLVDNFVLSLSYSNLHCDWLDFLSEIFPFNSLQKKSTMRMLSELMFTASSSIISL